jgi:hypothetical protein
MPGSSKSELSDLVHMPIPDKPVRTIETLEKSGVGKNSLPEKVGASGVGGKFGGGKVGDGSRGSGTGGLGSGGFGGKNR